LSCPCLFRLWRLSAADIGFCCTQRVSGETPLQQRDRYKAEAERLRQALATLADAVAAERAAREYWRGVDYHADTLVALAVAEQAAREVLQ